MNNKEKATLLISKYLAGQCTEEEKSLVETFYFDQYVQQPVNEHLYTSGNLKADMWAVINNGITKKQKSFIIGFRLRMAIAASVLLFICAGAYLFLLPAVQTPQVAIVHVPDFTPATNKAILTLANGKQIVLNQAHKGNIAQQAGTMVNKTADDELVYTRGTAEHGPENTFNAVSVPRGGRQYHLVLADGTNVWLNAASSIKYPTVFNSKDRLVSLEGEAYFEVAHDKAHPFRVTSRGQTVEVLGTHFNINAYADEPEIKTTLMEGSVKVNNTNGQLVLKPGQQSVAANASLLINYNVDTDQVLAWKNNEFNFNETDIRSIMRQLGRWYDVDIEFKNIPNKHMSGTFSRNMNSLNVLKLLEFSGVKLKIEGRKITVL